ncbi:hypothetical protein ES703_62445 [subsurface metagenome]
MWRRCYLHRANQLACIAGTQLRLAYLHRYDFIIVTRFFQGLGISRIAELQAENCGHFARDADQAQAIGSVWQHVHFYQVLGDVHQGRER